MEIICPVCKETHDKPIGSINRALKVGLRIYCSRKCSGLARRNNKTKEQKILEKAAYDSEYRSKNADTLKVKKSEYAKSQAGRKSQRKQRAKKKLSGYHNEYCRRPEQREKERLRRHIRENKLGEKFCIVCEKTKSILLFEHWSIRPDNRSYLCKECESEHQKEYGCKTKNVVTAMVMRPYTNLTREDIVKHPYLVEANKFLILLKQLTK